MLERGLEDVSVQCVEEEKERTRQAWETPWGIEEICRDAFIKMCTTI